MCMWSEMKKYFNLQKKQSALANPELCFGIMDLPRGQSAETCLGEVTKIMLQNYEGRAVFVGKFEKNPYKVSKIA